MIHPQTFVYWGMKQIEVPCIPEELTDEFITTLVTDNEDKLIELLEKTGTPNMAIKFPKPVFEILEDSPPIISAAAFFRSFKCVRTLLSYDINLQLRDRKGKQLPFFIAAGGSIDVLKDVTTSTKSENNISLDNIPPDVAAYYGSIDIIRYLYLQGINFNKNYWSYRHPVMYACMNGHLDVVEFLIENGAPVNFVCCFDKNSLLHYACMGGHGEVVKYLVEKGADTNAVNKEVLRPIIFASESGSFEAVKILNELDPRANRNRLKYIPFVRAAACGHLDIVNFFLQQGVDIHIHEKDGTTALSAACDSNHPKVVSFLLSKIFSDDKNLDKAALFHQVVETDNPQFIELLLRYAEEEFKENEKIRYMCYTNLVRHGDLDLLKKVMLETELKQFHICSEDLFEDYLNPLIEGKCYDMLQFCFEHNKFTFPDGLIGINDMSFDFFKNCPLNLLDLMFNNGVRFGVFEGLEQKRQFQLVNLSAHRFDYLFKYRSVHTDLSRTFDIYITQCNVPLNKRQLRNFRKAAKESIENGSF